MAKGDKPKDAREALTQLEKRLRDLERELRASAPPAPAAAEPAEAPAAPPATEPAAPQAPAAPPVPEPPAAAQAPAPEGPPAPVVPPPVPAEIEVLVEEARVRADALRESLESLVDVNDHLRETAGTVIEDHGRALAELDAARAEPAAEPVPPPRPDPDAEFAALAPGAPPPARPPWEPAEPQRPRRRRWLTVLLLLLLLGALAAAAYVVRERRRDQSTPTPTTPAPAAIAVSAPTGMQLGIVGARRFTANAAPQAVCAGVAVAAIVEAADATLCATAVVITTVTDSASGLVGPRLKGGGRRCFSIVHDEELAPHDDDPALNRRRAAAIEAARATAQTAARTDQLPPARVARAGNDAAAQAATAWDARRGLVSRAVAAQPGATCVRPTPANVRSGRYPLAHRVSLIATSETRAAPAVTAAAAALRIAFGGETPLDADVLR